ncbi:hypothetical protein CRYUN_Cryun21dG0042600 [Craigia yunnanensis]
MAQIAKIEVQTEMKSSADKVYDIFKRKMYLMPKICPELVKEVKLAKGDWETTFKSTVSVTASGQGSLVKWTLIYEKQNQNIPDPEKYLEFASSINKSVDAYLLKH